MKGSDVFPSKWLRATDLNGKEPVVTIDRVLYEELNEREQKPVIYFKKVQKGMVCNVTNWKRMAHIFRSDESDDWVGKQITLYVELVDMRGEMKEAIRVRATPKNGPGYQVSSGDQDGVKTVKNQPPIDDGLDDSIPF